ncbi:MAG: adenine phosphoribosyltransferase [Myxococcales bacterium]|nr:adenine phosphoribosyltransferase [Myxococcales bacterium]
MSDDRLDAIRDVIRDVPDFPKPGIMFKDITPLLADPRAFNLCLDLMAERYDAVPFDAIVGIESRGFIFGAALASRMRKAFVPARKPGKLPAQTYQVEYELEYGTDAVEMHKDAITQGERALIVDDLIATGGTAWATGELIRRLGGEVIGAAFVVELSFLKGRERLAPMDTFSLVDY